MATVDGGCEEGGCGWVAPEDGEVEPLVGVGGEGALPFPAVLEGFGGSVDESVGGEEKHRIYSAGESVENLLRWDDGQ
jgi:hypothetical protein